MLGIAAAFGLITLMTALGATPSQSAYLSLNASGPYSDMREITGAETVSETLDSFIFLPLNLHRFPPPPVPTDLLLNSGFEEGYTDDTYNGTPMPGVLTPKHWITWWEDEPSSVMYPMHVPEVRPIPNEGIYYSPVPRIRSGYYAIQAWRTWGRYRAGFYQSG